MSVQLPGVIVDPQGQSRSITILSEPSGATPTVYADPFGVTQITMPKTITASTQFYLPSEGQYSVNGLLFTIEGTEAATVQIPAPYVSALGVAVGTKVAASIPYYNVKDFGATGNGTTDDTAAINSVWPTLIAAPGWLVFPKGTYLISGAIMPTSQINGLHIIGAGPGSTVIQAAASYNQGSGGPASLMRNNGNDSGWLVEGFSFGVGTSVNNLTQHLAGPDSSGSVALGAGMAGFFAVFLQDSIIQDCTTSGNNYGVYDFSGLYNDWRVVGTNNQNAGILMMDCLGSRFTSYGGVANASGSATSSDGVANIMLATQTGAGAQGCRGCIIDVPVSDEIGLSTNGGGASIWVGKATDCTISARQVYGPGKKQASGNPYYGIRIGPASVRTTVHRTRVQPFTVDTTRVPDHTILIESGATNTNLVDVSTNPNLANGGGDLSDSGTATVYRNVRLNDGASQNSIATKAGVPSDADYQVAPPIGTQVLDTTDGKIYYRTASATWKAATLT